MRTLADTADRTLLLQRLRRLTPATPRRWGRMNAHQMVCHLSNAFRLGLGEKEASHAGGLFTRTVLKWGALWVPLPWPHGYPTRPEMDQLAGGTPPAVFAHDVVDLERLIERFTRTINAAAEHPVFGRLSQKEWLRWGWRHAHHHLRQFGA